MTNHELPSIEINRSPAFIAEEQSFLGGELANLYENAPDGIDPPSIAEIALRNPVAYLQEKYNEQLHPELQKQWDNLSTSSENLVHAAAIQKYDWAKVSGLKKLQTLISRDEINPNYRGPVSEVIREVSKLFAQSSLSVAGDTKYYAGNVQLMARRLQEYRVHHE